MPSNDISLFLSGDSILTRPWSHVQDASFLGLIDQIRAADVAITNLETVIHEFKGYAQADCGGIYIASPRQIADELKWAGFDMLAHANNHTFDYGSTGVLETLEHVERAGLVLAGSGRDLKAARAPGYVRCNRGTVALVAMATDFIRYGKASSSRPDMPGRPGLNPLAVTGGRPGILVPEEMTKRLRHLKKLGLRVLPSDHYGLAPGIRVNEADLRANLDAIAAAAAKADVVVASLHSHRQGAWLRKIAHQAIEHGASVVFIHGPHKVCGIELFDGRPIFYSMGDFVFELDCIARYPAEAFESRGLPADARLDDIAGNQTRFARLDRRQAFEGFGASIVFSERNVARIGLIPVELQFKGASEDRGRPRLAASEIGRAIIAKVARTSKRYRTHISWDEERRCGEVALS